MGEPPEVLLVVVIVGPVDDAGPVVGWGRRVVLVDVDGGEEAGLVDVDGPEEFGRPVVLLTRLGRGDQDDTDGVGVDHITSEV